MKWMFVAFYLPICLIIPFANGEEQCLDGNLFYVSNENMIKHLKLVGAGKGNSEEFRALEKKHDRERTSYDLIVSSLKQSANNGNTANQLELGKMYLYHKRDLKENKESALCWITKAVNSGNTTAQEYLNTARYELGRILLKEGDPRYVNLLETAAEENHEASISLLTFHYYFYTFEYQKAAYWYSKHCHLGDSQSCIMVAEIYNLGLGVKKNSILELKWLIEAVNRGSISGYFNLGYYYDKREDYFTAAEWYEEGVKRGCNDCAVNLGFLYLRGEGTRQNHRTAKELFGIACDNGVRHGCKEYKKLNEAGY